MQSKKGGEVNPAGTSNSRFNRLKDSLEHPEKLFIVLATFFGVLIVFFMPLFAVPDEPVHFYRAYQIGGGHLTSLTINNSTGGYVPDPALLQHRFSSKLPSSAIKFKKFPSSAFYSPVAYIPQAIGIDIGRLVYPSIDTLVLFGRLANLAAYIGLVWLAIKIAKHGKWVYAVAGLFPVALQEAASLSADVMNIGLGLVTIALIHRLFLQNKKISRGQSIGLIFLALGLGLTKQTNLILLLPLLFLPRGIFNSVRQKRLLIFGTLIIGILAAFIWLGVVITHHYNTAPSEVGLANVNQSAQLSFILHHPIAFIETILKTYVYEGFRGTPLPDFYWTSMYGYFSTFVYKLPALFISLGYMVLLVTLLYTDRLTEQARKQMMRLAKIQMFILILSVVSIAGALYLTWTSVGQLQVSGIQGRYFISLIPLLIPLFTAANHRIKIVVGSPRVIGSIVASVATINLTFMLLLTYLYFH